MTWLTPQLANVIVSILTLIGVFIGTFYIRQVKHHINSRMTELLELTSKSSHAAGMKQEKNNVATARRKRGGVRA